MNSRYKIHAAIDEQIRAFGKTNLANHLRESAQRDSRVFDGKVSVK